MEKLTSEEKKRIEKAIDSKSEARNLYDRLRYDLKWFDLGHCSEDYPIASETVAIYENEIVRKCMEIAFSEAEKSKCFRKKVGAVLEKDGEVIGKGYNGVPYNLIECTSEGLCFKIKNNIKSGSYVDEKDCRAMHAEEFALLDACRRGKCTAGATLFVTHRPCFGCALRLIAAGVIEVYCKEPYPDELALEVFHKAGVEIHYLE